METLEDGKPYLVDYAAIARAYGAEGVQITSADECKPARERAIAQGYAVLYREAHVLLEEIRAVLEDGFQSRSRFGGEERQVLDVPHAQIIHQFLGEDIDRIREVLEIGVRAAARHALSTASTLSGHWDATVNAIGLILPVNLRPRGVVVDLAGPRSLGPRPTSAPDSQTTDLVEWARRATPSYLNLRKASIYGGSNEVQRQIISRNILGL